MSAPLTPFPLPFYARDPVRVARDLLGATLTRVLPNGEVLSGRVTDVEAYDCPRDPACTAGRFHAARSAELSAPPGLWAFWVTHGHPLLQVTCREEGVAASVLIRALEPLSGVPLMLGFRPVVRELDLTSGPAKLVQALHVTPLFRGQRADAAALHLSPGLWLPDAAVEVTARIGIRDGQELPWRFVARGSRWRSQNPPSRDLGTMSVTDVPMLDPPWGQDD